MMVRVHNPAQRDAPLPTLQPQRRVKATQPRSLGPGRDNGRALHDGPLVLVGGNHCKAVGFAAFPGGAVAVFVELPVALAPGAAVTGGYAPNLALPRECHF